MAALVNKTPTQKDVNNNALEATLESLGIKNTFLKALSEKFGFNMINGNPILNIAGGKLEIRNLENFSEVKPEQMDFTPEMNNLLMEAYTAKDAENTFRGTSSERPFSNNFTGFEHYLLGLIKLKNNDLGNLLVRSITGKTRINNKAIDEATNKIYEALNIVRGENARSGVNSERAYENYAIGNAKSFVTESKINVQPPNFLTEMQSNNYNNIFVRVGLAKKLAEALFGINKNSAELYSEFDGIGKKHVVYSLIRIIADLKIAGAESKYYRDFEHLIEQTTKLELYEIDLAEFQSGTQYRGSIEAKFGELSEFVKNSNGRQVVIVFRDMAGLKNLGETSGGGSQGFSQHFAKILDTTNTKAVAITNETTSNQIANSSLKDFFNKLIIEEPSKAHVRNIADAHFIRMKEDNPNLEVESLRSLFDFIYETAKSYPNLGDKLEGVFKVYEEIGRRFKESGETKAEEKHALEATSTLLGKYYGVRGQICT